MIIDLLLDIIFRKLRFVTGLIVIFIFLFLIKIDCALNPLTLILSVAALVAAVLERRSWKEVQSFKSLVEFESESAKDTDSSEYLERAQKINRTYIFVLLGVFAMLFASWLLC